MKHDLECLLNKLIDFFLRVPNAQLLAECRKMLQQIHETDWEERDEIQAN